MSIFFPDYNARQSYNYFDTPDGEDVFKKLWAVLKPTIPATGAIAMCDVVLNSHPKGYLAIAGRIATVAFPILGLTTTFVLATNAFASLRKKDDTINWFLGGFTTGSCIGIMKRNKMTGFNAGMAFGLLALIRKDFQLKGWVLFPKDHPTNFYEGGVKGCFANHTLTAERPRNWTTGEKK